MKAVIDQTLQVLPKSRCLSTLLHLLLHIHNCLEIRHKEDCEEENRNKTNNTDQEDQQGIIVVIHRLRKGQRVEFILVLNRAQGIQFHHIRQSAQEKEDPETDLHYFCEDTTHELSISEIWSTRK